jgi:hypothetical protein
MFPLYKLSNKLTRRKRRREDSRHFRPAKDILKVREPRRNTMLRKEHGVKQGTMGQEEFYKIAAVATISPRSTRTRSAAALTLCIKWANIPDISAFLRYLRGLGLYSLTKK